VSRAGTRQFPGKEVRCAPPGPTGARANALATDGYVVVRQVLSPTEVARLRSEVHAVLDQKGKPLDGSSVLPNAAAEAPSLSWVFAHERIVDAVRNNTNLQKLVFTAEADVHRNFLLGTWHKDSGEGNLPRGYFDCDAMSADDCLVYKVALYLQDHLDGSGLTVRPGTTHQPDLAVGDAEAVTVRAGDMILFDVRITHRGTEPTKVDSAINKLQGRLNWRSLGSVSPILRRWKYKLTNKPDRLAVYFAFGAPNERSETFAFRNMQRQLAQLNLTECRLPVELTERLSSLNIEVATLSARTE
jgi:hypothetical protein